MSKKENVKIELSLLKIILLNDMLNTALVNLNPNTIQDRNEDEKKLKLQLRNNLKACAALSKVSDYFFQEKELTSIFGDVAEIFYDLYEGYINNKMLIQGQDFINFPDGISNEMFTDMFKGFLSGEYSVDPRLHGKVFFFDVVHKKSGKDEVISVRALNEEDAIILFKARNKGYLIKEIKS